MILLLTSRKPAVVVRPGLSDMVQRPELPRVPRPQTPSDLVQRPTMGKGVTVP